MTIQDWFFVGVDLGQSRDFTAIAAVERVVRRGEWDAEWFAWRKEVGLQLRYLERVPLGTPYPEVVERVVGMTRSRELEGRCHLAVDATGVGRPVVDLLRSAGPGCTMLPVMVTGGERETMDQGYYRVPKRDLIIGLQVLLQQEGLKIAAGLRYGEALVREMAGMQVRVTASGNEQYGAWREGTHDDLVFAVALACWNARKVYPEGREEWCTQDEREAARIFQRAARWFGEGGDRIV